MNDQTEFDRIRGLVASVMLSAFEAIQAACRPKATGCEMARGKHAYFWIMSEDRGETFAYLACCDVLELNPAHGRTLATRIVYGESSLSEAVKGNKSRP